MFDKAVVALDLEKCYETIGLEVIWLIGMVLGFPRDILDMALRMFAAPRVIVKEQACSEPAENYNSLPAGSRLANRIVKMLL